MKRGTTPIRKKKRTPGDAKRVYGPHEFREWLHGQPCAVCGAWSGHTEQAHVGNEGKSRKAGWKRSIPLCGTRPHLPRQKSPLWNMMLEGCHRELHRIGVQSFQAKHNVDLEALVAKAQAAWKSSLAARSADRERAE